MDGYPEPRPSPCRLSLHLTESIGLLDLLEPLLHVLDVLRHPTTELLQSTHGSEMWGIQSTRYDDLGGEEDLMIGGGVIVLCLDGGGRGDIGVHLALVGDVTAVDLVLLLLQIHLSDSLLQF